MENVGASDGQQKVEGVENIMAGALFYIKDDRQDVIWQWVYGSFVWWEAMFVMHYGLF
jgi:hypothetical protein